MVFFINESTQLRLQIATPLRYSEFIFNPFSTYQDFHFDSLRNYRLQTLFPSYIDFYYLLFSEMTEMRQLFLDIDFIYKVATVSRGKYGATLAIS